MARPIFMTLFEDFYLIYSSKPISLCLAIPTGQFWSLLFKVNLVVTLIFFVSKYRTKTVLEIFLGTKRLGWDYGLRKSTKKYHRYWMAQFL